MKIYSFNIQPWMLLFVMVFGLFACDKPTLSSKEKDLVLTPEEQEMVTKSNDFAFQLYKESLSGLSAKENALISPISIQMALAMTYQGAKGETEEAIITALGLEGFEKAAINDYFQKLLQDLPALDAMTQLEIANSIWYRQSFNVLSDFLKVNSEFYKAEVNPLDFGAPDAPDQINQWVNQKTREKIQKIIDDIDSETMMILLNAVYFKGGWEEQFDESDTHKAPFYTDNQEVQADFMKLIHSFKVYSNPRFQAVEMPYGNKKYSMVAVLPAEEIQIADLIDQLNVPATAGDLLHSDKGFTNKVQLYFPRFKFSYANSLNDELTALGMGNAFMGGADFTGIADEDLAISEVKHKSFIEVNEEGTEAAAVTSVGIVVTSMPAQPFTLKFDRPFLFLIREQTSGLILFIGQINNPLSDNTEL